MSDSVICERCFTPRGRVDDKFCFACGTVFQEEKPPEQKKRFAVAEQPEEKEVYLPELKFCTDCGVSVDFEVKIRPKFCPECGNPYITSLPPLVPPLGTCPVCSCVHAIGPDGVKYCHQCGTSSGRFQDQEAKKDLNSSGKGKPAPPGRKPATKPERMVSPPSDPRERSVNNVSETTATAAITTKIQPLALPSSTSSSSYIGSNVTKTQSFDPTSLTKSQTIDPLDLTPRSKGNKTSEGGLLSFGQCMTHDVPSVIAQANIGMKVVQEMKELALKYKKLEEAHARALEKLLGEENKKVTKILEQDGMCLFGGVWVEFVGHLYGRVDIIRELSTRITEEVVSPLKTLESTAAMSLKELNVKVKDAQNEMTKVIETMNKSKEECVKTIQTAREALAREKVDTSELTATGKMGHFVSSLTHSSFVKKKGKALGLANTYIQNIKETNEAQVRFVDEILRSQLDQFQVLELQRLKQVALRLKSLVDVCKSQDEKMVAQDTSTYSLLETLDPEKDIQTYIQTWLIDYGMPPDVVPYVYEIPVTPADIDAMAEGADADVGKKRETIFNSTINSLMEKQKQINPQLDVPLVMHTLCDAIEKLGDGVKTEGVFRLSPDNSLLRATEAKFNQGDFTLSGPAADPIVASSLLKSWLRSLNEPVIPSSMYEEATKCIETMKQEIATKRSVAARQTLSQKGVSFMPVSAPSQPLGKGQDVHAAVLAVYNRLPTLHKNVVKRLASLGKLIVLQPKSRMTYESLAVCFAPCLFRSPDSTDPFVALKWSRTEKDFTFYLLSALDQAASAGAAAQQSAGSLANVSVSPPAPIPVSPRTAPFVPPSLTPAISQRSMVEKKLVRAAPPPSRALVKPEE